MDNVDEYLSHMNDRLQRLEKRSNAAIQELEHVGTELRAVHSLLLQLETALARISQQEAKEALGRVG